MKHRITLSKQQAQRIIRQGFLIESPALKDIFLDNDIVDVAVSGNASEEEWMDIYLEEAEG